MEENNNTFYVSPYLGLAPIFLFIAGALYLGLQGAPSASGFWPIVLAALILGLLLSRSPSEFAQAAVEGMADNTIAIMVIAWLLAGALGDLVSQSGVVEVISKLFASLGWGPSVYLIGVFLITSLIGTSTGTAVGTILLVTPTVFPAGIGIGVDKYWLLGAILAGGALGDDYSPISDTTIASARTQGVSIPNAVRSRLKYILVAGVISILIYGIAGLFVSSNPSAFTSNIDISSINVYSLLVLLGPILVVFLCYYRFHLLFSLLLGILVTIVISLTVGVFSPSDIFSVDRANYTANSVVIQGMQSGVGISIFSILLIGLVRACLSSGLMKAIFESRLMKSLLSYNPELTIGLFVFIANILTAHNTITIVSVGDTVSRIGEIHDIDNIRRANIVDLSANTFMHVLPYMITVILAVSLASNSASGVSLSAWKVGLFNIQSIALFFIVLAMSLLGLWRTRDRDEAYNIS